MFINQVLPVAPLAFLALGFIDWFFSNLVTVPYGTHFFQMNTGPEYRSLVGDTLVTD